MRGPSQLAPTNGHSQTDFVGGCRRGPAPAPDQIPTEILGECLVLLSIPGAAARGGVSDLTSHHKEPAP